MENISIVWNIHVSRHQEIKDILLNNKIRYIDYSYWVGNGQGIDGAGLFVSIKPIHDKINHIEIQLSFDKKGNLIIDKDLKYFFDGEKIKKSIHNLLSNYEFLLKDDFMPHLKLIS